LIKSYKIKRLSVLTNAIDHDIDIDTDFTRLDKMYVAALAQKPKFAQVSGSQKVG